MATIEIPLNADNASFTQETTLEGVPYLFTVRWNTRASAWYLHLADLDGVSIVASRKLVSGADLLRYVTSATRPPGNLMLDATPTRDNLGTDARLLYVEA